MISLLRGLMSSDADTNRPLLSLILLGIVDFVCILIGAESINDRHFFTGTLWIVAGVGSALIGYYWQQIKQKAGDWLVASGARLQKKNKAAGQLLTTLEIRPSLGQVLSASTERGFSHYRMDIYNSGPEMERNVQVRLVSIEPLPISEYFRARADFPYHVRLAHVADGPVDTSTDHDINPGTSKQFELLFFWESSDHRTMVDGIDTKQALSRDARFSMEDKECWHLKYEVSSAMTGIQRPSFLVRCEGNNLVMRRLI
jgi:hypothetical protein